MIDYTKLGEKPLDGAIDLEWQLFWEKMCLPKKIQIDLPLRKKKVIVLAGPTCVGKTALSLVLAKAIGGEIISADSMQVYRGMDIGTAKISPKEMGDIPHHLIDVRSLDQAFNVVHFCKEAHLAIEGICARDHVPIVVGGTGFYLHALLYGPPKGPASIGEVRDQWEKEIEEKGSISLFARLQELDPEYAKTITFNDKHKIARALEIISLTGKKVSEFAYEKNVCSNYDFRCWFLYLSRDSLYRKIEQRCDEMIEQGFLQEVERLDEAGLRYNTSAAQAIGYRQCLSFLDSPRSADDWQQFITSFKQASRRYAKRQFTWFRKEPMFRWLSRDELSFEKIAEVILQDFELSP